MERIQIVTLPGNEDLPKIEQMSQGASGFDLRAAISESISLEPGKRKLIPTGLALAMPIGLEAQVRPRSGLALKHGITVLNTPGTIDADYRGEIGVILINLGEETFEIHRGDRIAQLVFQYVASVKLIEVEQLEETARGTGGFGHTGK
ncbi:dUTP pyrophosphatase [Thermoactinomyces sp. DSM 45891]|uniref:dUTP diphosphatase n=1 Tax=Thermoactinomyces sp. DSM 45891 TaxID=1761907 RepID=UPI00092414DF|nr:dUTP diphosphatase [Thermoactinomyces sp. DSM 45891]SFX34937.1 dUTP pyrophosphatase [Thermoactinomyces sp. DSM 45891]